MTTAKRTRTPNMTSRVGRLVAKLGQADIATIHAQFPGKSYQNIYQALERAVDQRLIHRTSEDKETPVYLPGPAPARARYPRVFHYAQGVTA